MKKLIIAIVGILLLSITALKADSFNGHVLKFLAGEFPAQEFQGEMVNITNETKEAYNSSDSYNDFVSNLLGRSESVRLTGVGNEFFREVYSYHESGYGADEIMGQRNQALYDHMVSDMQAIENVKQLSEDDLVAVTFFGDPTAGDEQPQVLKKIKWWKILIKIAVTIALELIF
ncbi:MAG: hypothetical protein AAFY76_04525 [Cyanobacteria bacterium J06649_11]